MLHVVHFGNPGGSGFHLQRIPSQANVTKLTFVLQIDLKMTGLFVSKSGVAKVCIFSLVATSPWAGMEGKLK